MGDLPVRGQQFSPEEVKLKNEIEVKEIELRVMKLQLRKKSLESEMLKIDRQVVSLNERLKELTNKEDKQ